MPAIVGVIGGGQIARRTKEVTMSKRLIAAAAALSLCALMAGCLDIEEKVTIQPDGPASALLKIRLYLPKGGKDEAPPDLDIKAEGIGRGIEGFESATVTTREAFGQVISEIALKARSWKALAGAYDTLPREPEKKDSGVDVDRIFTQKGFWQLKKKGNSILMTRTFVPAKKKKAKKADEGMGDLVAMITGSMKLRIELDVPSDVVSSNAEEQDGRALRWVIPLDWLSSHKVVLKAEIESTPELEKALFK
jgi:hypothetical protein